MIHIRPIEAGDRGWIQRRAAELWTAETVVGHGMIYHPAALEGFVAEDAGRSVGLLTYIVEHDACEIVTIDAFEVRRGVGTALMEAAQALGHRRLWLVTTNDNVGAQRFYAHLGFRLVAVRRGEVQRSRRLKPEIPDLGQGDVPMRDELEYELTR